MARATTGISYLTLGLVILGGFILTVFVTVPAWSAWRATQARLEEEIRERDQRREFLDNIGERAADLKTYERDVRALGVAFPETKAPAELAAILHGISARNGVVVERVSELKTLKVSALLPAAATERAAEAVTDQDGPGGETPSQTASPVPAYEFSLAGRGTYAQVRSFLRDLERSLRLFDLPTVEITGGSLAETGIVEVKITLITYLSEP